jgi:FliI/YscN family ATPase
MGNVTEKTQTSRIERSLSWQWQGFSAAIAGEASETVWTHVTKVIGLMVEAKALKVPLGSKLNIETQSGKTIPVESVGFSPSGILLMPYGNMEGVAPGDKVVFETSQQSVLVGEELLGRVLDGAGDLIDGGPDVLLTQKMPLYRDAPLALDRVHEKVPFYTGVKAWDRFTSMGRGQRMGIFAGTGVGKSVLLGMIARESSADVNVLALVGERGHEVKEFIEEVLGPEGMKKTVLVVATSDQSPLMRSRAAFVAKAIAEYFASLGNNVLYMMDSVTRMAMAMRELGLSVGEPPTAKGYPPSVFAAMPRLLERAGCFENGSITSVITVLLEGDDLQDPIGDAARGILDGHVVLSRDLANRGHFPAVEVTESISRWMNDVAPPEAIEMALRGRQILADYKNSEDLINVGAYVKGSNPDIDMAIALRPKLVNFLKQGILDHTHVDEQMGALGEALSFQTSS